MTTDLTQRLRSRRNSARHHGHQQRAEREPSCPAYTAINAAPRKLHGPCRANTQFAVTHEKSMVIDGTTAVILTANLETTSYPNTRDFALIYNDPVDGRHDGNYVQTPDYNSTTDYSLHLAHQQHAHLEPDDRADDAAFHHQQRYEHDPHRE